MEVKNLAAGMRIRNYPAMCDLVGEKTGTGKSKQLQLKRWERYFRFHRDGYAFIIDEVFENPIPKPPIALTSRSIYVPLIEKLLISKLIAEHGEIKTGKIDLYRYLGFFNENYTDTTSDKIEKALRIFEKNEIRKYSLRECDVLSCCTSLFEYLPRKLNDILMCALKSMRRRNLIHYERAFIINEEYCGNRTSRYADKDEEIEILDLTSEFLKKNPRYYRISCHMIKKYFSELNKWIRDKRIKRNRIEWQSVYSLMRIGLNNYSHHNFQPADEESINRSRLELNRIIAEKINEHFRNDFERAASENRVLYGDWGERNKMRCEKMYPPNYLEIQGKLVDMFIRIK